VKNITKEDLMVASGIFGTGFDFGRVNALFRSIPGLLEEGSVSVGNDRDVGNLGMLTSKIKKINGFSDKLVGNIVRNLDDAIKIYCKYKKYLLEDAAELSMSSKPSNTSIYGNKFVFSGFRDDLVKQFITSNKGYVSSTVSIDTHQLIVKAVDVSSNKLEKAKKLNINIITLEDFKNKHDL
jgi:NAD-dependent DNA ligase